MLISYTEFFIAKAPHANNREMIHCMRYENNCIINDCWVELHRLQPYSPTGIFRIIERLKR